MAWCFVQTNKLISYSIVEPWKHKCISWIYSAAQKSGISSLFFIFWFQATRLSCNLLKWSWAIVLKAFWGSFKVFLWTLAYSPIFSPVLVPEHFQRNVFLLLKTVITELWFIQNIKKATNSRDEPDCVSTHNRHLSKEPVLNSIFRHFVTSSLSQRHIICLVPFI